MAAAPKGTTSRKRINPHTSFAPKVPQLHVRDWLNRQTADEPSAVARCQGFWMVHSERF